MFVELGCIPDVGRLLTKLTTHSHRLPQGAPASPGLANLYLRLSGLAARIDGLAARHCLQVTFFGDDILISSEQPFHGLTAHLAQIVEDCGLRLHRARRSRGRSWEHAGHWCRDDSLVQMSTRRSLRNSSAP
jgi:hypothetical protein